MFEIVVEALGWIGSVLIVGAYGLNILGKLSSNTPAYIWMNMIGGLFFVVNTVYHHAYPSAVVNIIWVFIAIYSIINRKKS